MNAEHRVPQIHAEGEIGRSVPLQLIIGLALVILCWALYWTVADAWTEIFLFGLWLGYILTADGIAEQRTGTSMLTRNPTQFTFVFGYSILFWWMYEWFNFVLRNWYYVYPTARSNEAVHILLSSLTFSIILPAVFETAELLLSLKAFNRPRVCRPLGQTPARLYGVSIGGAVLLALALAFPDWLFFLVWLCPLLILDPINTRLGLPSLWNHLARGRWDALLVLACAGLVCGFFWEFWNYWTVGKHWIYQLPAIVPHVRLFRMPLLGYLGYLPFALSAYACYQTLRGLVTPAAADLLKAAAPAPRPDRREGETG